MSCLSVFDHFVGLALKGLIHNFVLSTSRLEEASFNIDLDYGYGLCVS